MSEQGDIVDPDLKVNRLSETGVKYRTRYLKDGYLTVHFITEKPMAIYYFTEIDWWVERSNGLLIKFKDGSKYDRLLIPWHNITEFMVRTNTKVEDDGE